MTREQAVALASIAAGLVLVVTGAAMLWLPAAFILAGLLLALFGYAVMRGSRT